MRATIWICIWEGADNKLDLYFGRCGLQTGLLFGTVQATYRAHICENARVWACIWEGRATNWTFIWEGGGYKQGPYFTFCLPRIMGPYFLKCEQMCGCVFGKVRTKNWAHICENASNSLASYPGRCQQQPGPLFGKLEAINWAHIFENANNPLHLYLRRCGQQTGSILVTMPATDWILF
jgi:hypothetical protein